MGFVSFRKRLKPFWQTRERERDREIDEDENVIWRNVDANCLLDPTLYFPTNAHNVKKSRVIKIFLK